MNEQRTFHYTDDKSDKFWNITLEGTSYTVDFGRVGTQGQSRSKQFDSAEQAREAYEKIIDEKVRKGYVEDTPNAPAPAPTATTNAAQPAKPKATSKAKAKAPVKAAPVAPPEPPPLMTCAAVQAPAPRPCSTENILHLTPLYQCRVLYGDQAPLPLPPQRPFDLKNCLKSLKQITLREHGYHDWEVADVDLSISRQEAHFWLRAGWLLRTYAYPQMSEEAKEFKKKALQNAQGASANEVILRLVASELDGMDFEQPLDLDADSMAKLNDTLVLSDGELTAILNFKSMSLDAFADWLWQEAQNVSSNGGRSNVDCKIPYHFRKLIVPCLTQEQKEQIRQRLEPHWDLTRWQPEKPEACSGLFIVCAAVGMFEKTRQLLDLVPDDFLANGIGRGWIMYPMLSFCRLNDWLFINFIACLDSREQVEAQVDRLGIMFESMESVRIWLAHTGTDRLDVLVQSARYLENKESAEEWIAQLGALIEGPALALPMLQMSMESKGAAAARRWLENYPEWTRAGLEATAHEESKLGQQAREVLQALDQASQPKALAPEAVDANGQTIPTHLMLQPSDWMWVTYRECPSLTQTAPKPLNEEKVHAELKKLSFMGQGQPDWDKVQLPNAMTREEAIYWLRAMLATRSSISGGEVIQTLPSVKIEDEVSLQSIRQMLCCGDGIDKVEICIMIATVMLKPLSVLLSLEDLVDFATRPEALGLNGFMTRRLAEAFPEGWRQYILPTLGNPERTRLREIIRPLTEDTKPLLFSMPHPVYYIAATAGLHEATLKLVELLSYKRFSGLGALNRCPFDIIYSLGSPQLVEQHIRRINPSFTEPEQMRIWLAHMGLEGLDYLAQTLAEIKDKKLAQTLVCALAQVVQGPALAPVMARLQESAAPKVATKWLSDHQEWAAAGLKAAAQGNSKQARQALEMARQLEQAAAREQNAPTELPPILDAPPKVQPIDVLPESLVPHNLRMAPAEYWTVTYQEHAPLPPAQARPFDLEALIELANKTNFYYEYRCKWEQTGMTLAMSKEEAEFWVQAKVTEHPTWQSAQKRLDKLRQRTYTGQMDLSDLKCDRLHDIDHPLALVPLWVLFGIDQFADVLDLIVHKETIVEKQKGCSQKELEDPKLFIGLKDQYNPLITLAKIYYGLTHHLLPWLSEDEKTKLRSIVKLRLDPTFALRSWEYVAAAALGMHDEVLEAVESWPANIMNPNTYLDPEANYYQYVDKKNLARTPVFEILLGLGSRQLVEQHFDRLKPLLINEQRIHAWLAHTGLDRLDGITRVLRESLETEQFTPIFDTLRSTESPQTAVAMFELTGLARTGNQARAWLTEHPSLTAAGLLPLVAAQDKNAPQALAVLRSLIARGQGDAIKSVLDLYDPAQVEGLRARVFFDAEPGIRLLESGQGHPYWLGQAVREAAKTKLPDWVQTWSLPPLKLGRHTLNDQEAQAVLWSLSKSTLEAPLELIGILRTHGETAANEAFAWEVFEQWMRGGAPSKEKWGLWTIGLLGSDSLAIELAKLIRKWPGEAQHIRAVWGLECLRTIGTETALMQINGIANKVSFKALKECANQCMASIAQARNMSRDELEDRIVPDCGLDEQGHKEFDFGPRSFRFMLGPDMKPMVRDTDGKLKGDLPKPAQKDDAQAAKAAVDDWKLIKKQVREVAKLQAWRLEQAMVTQRRWSWDEFERLLMRHPLMGHLVRQLLWGGYDENGRLTFCFRVSEDLETLDVQDDPFTPDKAAHIGVVHPLEMDVATRGAWGQILGDYKIISPFAQLTREIYGLEPSEISSDQITRFAQCAIPTVALVHTLDRQGWTRDTIEEGGSFSLHYKPFHGAGITAAVEYEYLVVGDYEEGETSPIHKCTFHQEIWNADYSHEGDNENGIPLAQVAPHIMSEVLRDLHIVASKSK